MLLFFSTVFHVPPQHHISNFDKNIVVFSRLQMFFKRGNVLYLNRKHRIYLSLPLLSLHYHCFTWNCTIVVLTVKPVGAALPGALFIFLKCHRVPPVIPLKVPDRVPEWWLVQPTGITRRHMQSQRVTAMEVELLVSSNPAYTRSNLFIVLWVHRELPHYGTFVLCFCVYSPFMDLSCLLWLYSL